MFPVGSCGEGRVTDKPHKTERAGEGYSLWTVPRSSWGTPLESVAVKLVAPTEPNGDLAERLKAFDAPVDHAALSRDLY
jgi:hypothetical protein